MEDFISEQSDEEEAGQMVWDCEDCAEQSGQQSVNISLYLIRYDGRVLTRRGGPRDEGNVLLLAVSVDTHRHTPHQLSAADQGPPAKRYPLMVQFCP